MMRNGFFLIADDDRDDIELLENSLTSIDRNIRFAAVPDGRKAVEFLQNCPDDALPSAIILDYNMPHINGPSMLEWLCADRRYDGINKFIWSTAFQQEYINNCLQKGAIQYFIKPINMEGIDEIVKEIISLSENIRVF